jgi:single-strand DNA-binding protein
MAQRSVNKVILLGHLGRDAETRFTQSGVAKSTFSLATNRRVKDAQTAEWRDETDWHNIVIWKAENVSNYLTKGKMVYVEGRLQSRSYDDKDGVKKYITEVVADQLILLGGDRGGVGGDPPGIDAGESGGYGGYEGGGRSGPVSMPRGAQRPAPPPARSQPPQPPPDDMGQGGPDDDVPF